MTQPTSNNAPQPKQVHPERQERIRPALQFFSIAAWVTGVFLIFLVVRMVLEYGFGMEMPGWATIIAIVHGWVYMAFVISCLMLGMRARWDFGKIILTALAGVVPFFSFFMEAKRRREVKEQFQLA